MRLSQLLLDMDYTVLQGEQDREISTLVYDSRKVEQDSVFVCISGAVRDGHDFAPEVAAKGATVLIVEKEVTVPDEVTVIRVADSRLALAQLSAAYFDHPAKELTTIGITGTKGKTTATYMVRSILEASGFKTGLIGTIETIIGDTVIPSVNTTPESYVVQESFRKMVDAGCKCVVMEVSSQALMLHRVSGFVFDYGIFTNLEPDHIGPESIRIWQTIFIARCFCLSSVNTVYSMPMHIIWMRYWKAIRVKWRHMDLEKMQIFAHLMFI